MSFFKVISFVVSAWALVSAPAFAQSAPSAPAPEVEWYPPEIEKSRFPERAKVIISGRTQPKSLIRIEGDSINVLTSPSTQSPEKFSDPTEDIERRLRGKCRVYEHPQINTRVIDILPKGAKVQTTEYTSTWVQVYVSKGAGYVSQACFVPLKRAGRPGSPSVPRAPLKIESRQTKANAEGFFEIPMDLPEGINQVPIQVTNPLKIQKVFMISVDVSLRKNDIRLNQKISRRKPPAASKKYRFWGGAGFTYQTYNQSLNGIPDLSFNTIQAPGIMARGGYWGDSWGLDFYFRDAPGKIEAGSPLKVDSGSYHWRTMEAKGLYQFRRGPSSRLLRLPAQWQLRFGSQIHTLPFLIVDSSQNVTIEEHGVTTATLGAGLLLGQERSLSYEFAAGIQRPISSSGYRVSSSLGFEAQVGAAYKFAPNWRLGLFSYTQSLGFSYEYEKTGVLKTGNQKLFHSTFDLRLGYEF